MPIARHCEADVSCGLCCVTVEVIVDVSCGLCCVTVEVIAEQRLRSGLPDWARFPTQSGTAAARVARLGGKYGPIWQPWLL